MSKHHFVPQFLLRNWAREDGTIGIYHIAQNRIIRDKPENQAQKSNLYGKDQKVESAFSILEADTSPIITKLLSENLTLDDHENLMLRLFLSTQYARVPSQVTNWNNIITSMVKSIFSESNEFPPEIISEMKVELENPVWRQIEISFDFFPSILDLKLGLIKNNSEIEIIISQNPIVILNPLAVEEGRCGPRQATALTGTFLVMPISPQYAICLFDKATYAFTDFSRIASANKQDIELLNLCQFLNTEDCIFFQEVEQDFNDMSKVSESYRSKPKVTSSLFKSNQPGNTTKMIHGASENFPIDEKFSFLGFKESAHQLNSEGPRLSAIKCINAYKKTDLYKIFHNH